MTLNDLRRIRHARITSKNTISKIFLLSFIPALGIVFSVFAVLYVLRFDLTINGTPVSYGEPAYTSFFRSFFLIFILITLVIMALVILIIKATPKTVTYLDTTIDGEMTIYVEHKRTSAWINHRLMIVHDQRFDRSRVEDDPDTIKHGIRSSVFFLDQDLDVLSDQDHKGKLVLRHETKGRHTTYRTTITVRREPSADIFRFSTREVQRGSGKIRLIGTSKGIIRTSSSTNSYTIHPAIKRELIDRGESVNIEDMY